MPARSDTGSSCGKSDEYASKKLGKSVEIEKCELEEGSSELELKSVDPFCLAELDTASSVIVSLNKGGTDGETASMSSEKSPEPSNSSVNLIIPYK